jgi:F-type H+-transporting ATPase subunit gamma
MAERLPDIVAKIQNVQQLKAVFTAMRGIAASRAQNGRSLLAGIGAYTAIISQAIGEALNLFPTDVSAAPAPGRSKRPLTTRVEGIAGFTSRLADVLYGYIARSTIATADILFSRSTSGAIVIDRHSLLPIDFERFERPIKQQAPLITLAPELLLERLAAEYVYAQLCEAAAHAFVAENEARMIAMVAAKNNTETKLAGLLQRERQLRQEEITTEIVELAAGAEALRKQASSSA